MMYNHKLINDLAWAIGSPSLLDNTEFSHNSLLDTEWGQDQIRTNLDTLAYEDKHPQNIQQHLSKLKDFRLGFYFEHLVAYWFLINSQYQIIEKNFVINSEKRTLGEMDFIVKDLKSSKTIHLEVAVKFYLQVDHNDKSYWFGPTLRDRLDLKLGKLFQSQVLLSEKDEAKKALAEKDITLDEQKTLLKGRLFKYSAQLEHQLCWLSLDDYIKLADDDSTWIILAKTHWFAPVTDPDYNFLESEKLSKNQATIQLIEMVENAPVCMVKMKNEKEINRIFVTANNWQQQAINSLV